MERRFEMPWDGTLKVSTSVFVAMMLAVAGGTAWLVLSRSGGDPPAVLAGLLGPLAAAVTLPLAWAFAPRALVLGRGLLRVDRPLRPVEIPLASIRAVGRVPREALRGMVRTAGSGGAFGYYGRFWSRPLGAVRLYATRRDGYVLLDTGAGRYLVTPEDPDAFAAAVRAAAPGARPLGPAGSLEPAPGGRVAWKVLVPALLGVPLLVGAILLAAWGWAPRAVRLEGGAVVVERAWAAPVIVPLPPGGARPLAWTELRGLRKTSGASFGQVRFGRWRTPALGQFQLYAPRWGPAWLLETPEGPLVVMPDDPAAFDAALHERADRPGP
jgi:hypothetical protein